MNPVRLLVLAMTAALPLGAPSAVARTISVRVDGRAQPWDPRMNPKLVYGQGDGAAPRYVWGLDLKPGLWLRLEASGTVTVLPPSKPVPADPRDVSAADATRPPAMFTPGFLDAYTGGGAANGPDFTAPRARRGSWGPQGQPYRPADGARGFLGTRFPSYYIDRRSYPVLVNALIGAFVDADGTVLGQPFVVGTRATIQVPAGAVAIALGLNGETFTDNRGGYVVTITDRLPRVDVEVEPPPGKQP